MRIQRFIGVKSGWRIAAQVRNPFRRYLRLGTFGRSVATKALNCRNQVVLAAVVDAIL